MLIDNIIHFFLFFNQILNFLKFEQRGYVYYGMVFISLYRKRREDRMKPNECHLQFGKFIKKARLEKGLYQQEIAELVDITQSYLSYIERGERDVDLALALKLCDVLGLNIQDFIVNIKTPV